MSKDDLDISDLVFTISLFVVWLGMCFYAVYLGGWWGVFWALIGTCMALMTVSAVGDDL